MRRRTLILGTLALLAALLAAGAVRFVVLRPKPVPFFIAAEEPRPEYLPVYLADHLGYLRAENLAPTFVSGRDLPPGAPGVWLVDLTDFLIRGAAGGPDGVVVAVLGARPALYLLSTAQDPEFCVSRLKGSSVLTGEPLSVPETQFACVLQAHGLHLFRDVTPIPNLPPELHVGALEARIAAYLVSPEPRATLLTAGGLHVVASLGAALGDFPAAVAVAPRPCLADQREALAAFVRALYRAQLYLSHYGPSDAAPALARFFPDLEPWVLEALLARLYGDGVWAPGPLLEEGAFGRVTSALAGLRRLPRPAGYAESVDPILAREALERIRKPPKRVAGRGESSSGCGTMADPAIRDTLRAMARDPAPGPLSQEAHL